MSAVEGVYWAMVDSAHAALITAKVSPPSPEHIPGQLRMNFVEKIEIDCVESWMALFCWSFLFFVRQ